MRVKIKVKRKNEIVMHNLSTGVKIRAMNKDMAVSFAKSLAKAEVLENGKVIFSYKSTTQLNPEWSKK